MRLTMLKATSIILIIVALFSVIIGIVYTARGTLMEYHEGFIGITMEELGEDNPKLATLAGIFVRLAGTLFIGVGVLSIAIIHYGLRKAERWAWWATPDWDGRRKWSNGGDYQSCWRFSLDVSNSLACSVCYRHWNCSHRSF